MRPRTALTRVEGGGWGPACRRLLRSVACSRAPRPARGSLGALMNNFVGNGARLWLPSSFHSNGFGEVGVSGVGRPLKLGR